MIRARMLLGLLVLALGVGAFATTARASTSDEDSLASQIFAAINQKRAENGVAPLAFDSSLAGGAQGAAEYNRTNADGSCDPACHTAAGPAHFEIVYWGDGPVTATGAINTWMNSPPHRTNMLSSGATAGGVGVAIRSSSDPTRTWAVTWFNGGDTAPAGGGGTKTPTTKAQVTATTAKVTDTTVTTTAVTAPTTTALETTSSTTASTTTTSTTSAADLRAVHASNDRDDKTNPALFVLIGFVAAAGGGALFAFSRRRKAKAQTAADA